ncbi:unnamed protein product [Calypogeia fissa]
MQGAQRRRAYGMDPVGRDMTECGLCSVARLEQERSRADIVSASSSHVLARREHPGMPHGGKWGKQHVLLHHQFTNVAKKRASIRFLLEQHGLQHWSSAYYVSRQVQPR